MGNNARFDQPEMEQCEKNRLIRKERSDEITAALSGVILLGEKHWEDQVHCNMMNWALGIVLL